MSYLPKGLPEPVTETDKLDQPYWQGTRAGKRLAGRQQVFSAAFQRTPTAGGRGCLAKKFRLCHRRRREI